MSENYAEPFDEDDDDDQSGNEDFKNLRAKARKADKIERELAQTKRELAFVKAGIPMEDPRMSYFVKGYEGDLAPDAVRQAAIDAGFIQAPPPPEPDPIVQQAQQGQQAVMNAGSGVDTGFDETAIQYQMEQAFAQGGISALSDITQQYGVTFNPTPL